MCSVSDDHMRGSPGISGGEVVDAPDATQPGRTSLPLDAIIDGAVELAGRVGVDNISMRLLSEHLGVRTASLYWYFRKRDDFLRAMTERVLGQIVFATPQVQPGNWRKALRDHAYDVRKTFRENPILCDLVLLAGRSTEEFARLCAEHKQFVVSALMRAGLSGEDANHTYSAVLAHVRGSVVLEHLHTTADAVDATPDHRLDPFPAARPQPIPLIAGAPSGLHYLGAPSDRTFGYTLECLLEHAETLIAAAKKHRSIRPPWPNVKPTTADPSVTSPAK